ncbi:sensor histidine kinase [Ekhidna lutea]|nr:two-component regulator propeller domain-containing protein [Ekhidna lutea]
MIRLYSLLVCVGTFFLPLINDAQQLNQQKRLSQFVLRSWNTNAGLTSESVSEMVQTNDGYIWIGTYTGLHRFDGKDFTVFTNQNSDLPSSNVLRIEKGQGGELWLGTLHGIAIYENGVFTVPEKLDSVENLSIEEMLITRDGDLWFSTKSNNLFYYNQNSLTEFTKEFGVENSTVLSMCEDRNGNVYFGTDDSQLIIYSPSGTLVKYSLGNDLNGINVMESKSGLTYLGTGDGFYLWDGTELIKNPILGSSTVNSILIDENKTFWLGTMKGLFRYQSTTQSLDSLTEQNGIPNNIIEDLIFDSQGNVWVGTYRSGIFYLGDGSITSFTKNDGLATNIISSVTELNEETFLLGNENGSLNLLQNGQISDYKPAISIPSERLKNLFTDSKGRVWVCTYGGLVILDGPRSKHYKVSNGFPDNFIRLAYEDKDGTIWLGTKNAGLLLFESDDLSKWKSITIEDGLSSNYIMSIEENKNGDMIVATISGLNFIRDKEVFKTVTTDDGLPSNFMFSTQATSEYIWIASNDGLSGYSENGIVNFNTERGMPTNIIYDVIADKSGTLWMPAENAILAIKITALEAAAENPEKGIKVKQYDESYGMKNSHCLGAVLTFVDSKDRFWVPTIGGIVMMDPDNINTPSFTPSIIIEGIQADNVHLPLGEGVSVPSGTNRLLIDFTGISYAQTELLQFRYKLSPFDDEWVIASNERNAIYTNLTPGNYEFELQTGVEGNFTDSTLTTRIRIEASWWQTTWAKILLIFAVICLALFIYWIRLRSLRKNNIRLEETVTKRTEEIENQKRELKSAIEQLRSAQEQMIQSDKMASLGILAAGVAHEINNPLNFIQGGIEGLEQKLKKHKSIKKEDYGVLIGAVKEGISRASTIVHSLNEFSHASEDKLEPCDVHHLIDNCITMIGYRLKNGIELTKNYDSKEAIVLGNNGKLHQAFLNIITNSIQAIDRKGKITVETEINSENIFIEFIDSGHGIKPEHLTKITEPFFSTKEPGKGTGLGLSITYTIINEHKGKLAYNSEWGKGTTARVSLPLLKK